MDVNCGIYKITNPKGRIYIGQSTNIRKRRNAYRKSTCNDQRRLYNSIIKYGWETHVFEVIHNCDAQDLNRWEKYYGDLYDCRNPEVGLNIREYGNHGKHSEETCKKIGAIHKGKKISDAHKEALSRANKGKIVSEETKHKLKDSSTRLSEDISKRNTAEGNGMWGKKHSEETRRKIGLKSVGRIHQRRTAFMLLNTETGIFYTGFKEASESINMKQSTLYSKLSGKLINNTPIIKT